MLTKRTQILLEHEVWEKLVELSQKEKTSVGDLIRKAVTDRYLSNERLEKRRKALESTLKNRMSFSGKIDYKDLVNHGRKY